MSEVNRTIAVIGLGYVGLPLAIALSSKFSVLGFDVDQKRVAHLKDGDDWTLEVDRETLLASGIKFTSDTKDLVDYDTFIVAVPTPVTEYNRPDLERLERACELIGPSLRPGAIVIFESTVYPGVTEDVCAPALEKASGLVCGRDFKLGYSPERINPGDKEHPIEKIVKVVSGQDEETLETVAGIYEAIIDAGVHRAPSIKVAETAKVIENTQRDINIAFMNELAKICHLEGIRTADVLEAAKTKWNFLPFTPGLVGGHCIGVDPYYLTSKAEAMGYHPEVILSGRRINDTMAQYMVDQIIQRLIKNGRPIRGSKVGILGMAFKENVPDIRNSKVVDLVTAFEKFGTKPLVCDPLVNGEEASHHYDIDLTDHNQWSDLDVLILAVPHEDLKAEASDIAKKTLKDGGLFVDLKSVFEPGWGAGKFDYWSV